MKKMATRTNSQIRLLLPIYTGMTRLLIIGGPEGLGMSYSRYIVSQNIILVKYLTEKVALLKIGLSAYFTPLNRF
jgi:hypothetical protein